MAVTNQRQFYSVMAQVEPLIGHLLSKHEQTIKEGLHKIQSAAKEDSEFTQVLVRDQQAMEVLKGLLARQELAASVVETLCLLTDCCGAASSGNAARSSLIREFLQDGPFAIFKKSLASSSDESAQLSCAVLQLFGKAAKYVPKVILARFHNQVPLQLACFRQQLPFSQRRLRLHRCGFLLSLATSRFLDHTVVIQAHGFLTHILEDGAALLLEGSPQGEVLGKQALQVLDDGFVRNRMLSAEKKRAQLLSQRNILRILSRALDYTPVAEEVAQLLFAVIEEVKESPADYARSRIESDAAGGDDVRGMPNYLLFLMLRQLHPAKSPKHSELVSRILSTAPDLIRPYFARVSAHLVEDTNSSQHGAPVTARIATLNVLTRILVGPLPYHLTHALATFTTAASPSTTFYQMSPRDVADEVCPVWMPEFVHRLINGSSDLLLLVLAMQLTQAALTRASQVLEAVRSIGQKRSMGSADCGNELQSLDGIFRNDDEGEQKGLFEAEVEAALLASLPKREEFWHRMTQQLHPLLFNNDTAAASGSKKPAKLQFIIQRMFLLMQSYTTVFRLRVSWISVVSHQLPALTPQQQQAIRQRISSSRHPLSYVSAIIQADVDEMLHWSPASITSLSCLVCGSMMNGVPMSKLHHITMSGGKGVFSEWPLLLRLLLWTTKQISALRGSKSSTPALARKEACLAIAWVARVVQWAVHGVTVSLGCEWEEAFLWLEEMQLEAVPQFLHLLNHVLQRSLSKAADRVTQEFAAAKHGVLAMAAENFIAKTKEKAVDSAAAAEKAGSKNTSTDAWVEDMKLNLPVFEKVLNAVVKRWDERREVRDFYTSQILVDRSSSAAVIAPARTPLAVNATFLMPSAMEQWMSFRSQMCSPIPPASSAEEDFSSPLLSLLKERGSQGLSDVLAMIKKFQKKPVGQVKWYQVGAVCWEVAGVVLMSLVNATDEEMKQISRLSSNLLQLIAAESAAIAESHATQREEFCVGFYFMVLALLHCLLNDSKGGHSSDEFGGIVTLLRDTYRGSVGVTDRIRYAALLTLHYIGHSSANVKEGTEGKRQVFRGCLVPQGIKDNRLLIWGHSAASYLTPEVDMLSFMTDLWTDQELTQMSLEMPARLHNTLLCGARNRHIPFHDITRAIFPEVTVEEDLTHCFEAAAYSTSIMDPRYMLPLMQSVFALPAENVARRFLCVRCFPYLLRSLSFTDPSLRSFAVAALASMTIPASPVKIVHSFARLKMLQLSQKKASKSEAADSSSPVVPRMPATMTSFLVLALKPLGKYDDPMHHFLSRFLIDTHEAFAVAVPFHQWLFSFPLESISVPLMIQQHELRLRNAGGVELTSAEGSSAASIEQLKKSIPPHLPFILRLLSFGCQTNGDAAAITSEGSQCLEGLMLVASMLSVSKALRLQIIQCITSICFAQSSSSVATHVAHQGRLFMWFFQFLQQLAQEYGESAPGLYAEPLFCTAMATTTRLSYCVLQQQRNGKVSYDIGDQLVLLRRSLEAAHVTAMEPLSWMEKMEVAWSGKAGAASFRRRPNFPESRKRPMGSDSGNAAKKKRRV